MLCKRIFVQVLVFTLIAFGCVPNTGETSLPDVETGTSTKAPVGTYLTPSTRIPGCTVVSSKTTENSQESLIPSPIDEDWMRGPDDAYVTIIEYGDFQCAGSASIEPVLAQLRADHPEDLRIIYRHFPLSSHDKAALATQAAEAAGKQGKFWEMHDLLFKSRSEWIDLAKDGFISWLDENSLDLGLDNKQFIAELGSESMILLAKKAFSDNSAIGMSGTPFLVINGFPYNGPLDHANLSATVNMILMEKRQFSFCPPMTIDPEKQYIAILQTEKGNIQIELYAEKAPFTVNSFIFLARQGWFDSVTFHRVIEGFVAQAGDPSGTGFGGPGYAFANEISSDLTFDGSGVVGMANSGPDSNGSQFFITYTAIPRLNGSYTIFGRVISGMDVVEKLTVRDPSQSMDLPPGDLILSVTIEEK